MGKHTTVGDYYLPYLVERFFSVTLERRSVGFELEIWACEMMPEFVRGGGMICSGNGLPRGTRWICPRKNFVQLSDIDKPEIQCIPMCLTDAERNAPYMANVELNLSMELQYIHHDSWKSCCEPLGDASSSSRHRLATKKRKLGQPMNRHPKKLAVECLV